MLFSTIEWQSSNNRVEWKKKREVFVNCEQGDQINKKINDR